MIGFHVFFLSLSLHPGMLHAVAAAKRSEKNKKFPPQEWKARRKIRKTWAVENVEFVSPVDVTQFIWPLWVQVNLNESLCKLSSLHGSLTSIHVFMSTRDCDETYVMLVVTSTWMKDGIAFEREKIVTQKILFSINVLMVGNCHRSSGTMYFISRSESESSDCAMERKSSSLQLPLHPLPVI